MRPVASAACRHYDMDGYTPPGKQPVKPPMEDPECVQYRHTGSPLRPWLLGVVLAAVVFACTVAVRSCSVVSEIQAAESVHGGAP